MAGELERRRALGYPPFRHLLRVVVTGPDQDAPLRALARSPRVSRARSCSAPRRCCDCAGRFRAQLVAKTSEPRRVAARAGRLLAAAAPAMRRAGLTAVVDVDPQSL
jgi:primosomal protein N' (replication factor Y)